jgi:hypothetical protein
MTGAAQISANQFNQSNQCTIRPQGKQHAPQSTHPCHPEPKPTLGGECEGSPGHHPAHIAKHLSSHLSNSGDSSMRNLHYHYGYLVGMTRNPKHTPVIPNRSRRQEASVRDPNPSIHHSFIHPFIHSFINSLIHHFSIPLYVSKFFKP